MRNDPEVQQAVSIYQLGLPRMPVSGRSGELLGRGTGTSLEFQEYREYMPGDDIRHLDWAAYARSDSLMVRLYREEISPRMEVLLDVSRSMTTSNAKTQLARQLAAVFALMSGATGSRPQIWMLGEERPAQSIPLEMLEQLEAVSFAANGSMDALLADHGVPLQRQSVRVVISDFLFPHEPGPLIRRLAREASVLWVIQILTGWETNPEQSGGTRLIDIETSHETDLFLNRQVIAEYRERLHGLQEELSLHCRRHHATFVPVVAEHGLKAVCREDLCRAEILRAS
jgi:uncharacterized protein (DUF58 family)